MSGHSISMPIPTFFDTILAVHLCGP